VNTGRVYDGRRQHQGRRPPRTPAQQRLARRVGYGIAFTVVAAACVCGGILVAAATWLLGWYQV
jgi:hypothetical protein